ncbi:MAG: hypothetical protein WBA31_05900, partial [Candidatus Dormiibacterota bacterium]
PKVERAASAYVGERLGYELTISQPLGFSRRRWERSVARAEQQRQSVLDALQGGGTEFVLRKELARRRRSERLGYAVAVVVGAGVGLILGMIVALPAWKVLAEPSIEIGTLVGAVGLPVWSYIGNRRARSRFKDQVLKRLSEIQSSPGT